MSTVLAVANENGNENRNSEKTWEKSDKEFVLVVITFIATVAFQAGINPPGGVWQENSKDHRAGQSIMATEEASHFILYMASITVCLAVSLVQVLLMFTELPYNRRSVSRNFLIFSCSIAVGSVAIAYWSALVTLTPKKIFDKIIFTLIGTIVIAVVTLSILVSIRKFKPKELDCFNSQG